LVVLALELCVLGLFASGLGMLVVVCIRGICFGASGLGGLVLLLRFQSFLASELYVLEAYALVLWIGTLLVLFWHLLCSF
jgi:hypothetical protein